MAAGRAGDLRRVARSDRVFNVEVRPVFRRVHALLGLKRQSDQIFQQRGQPRTLPALPVARDDFCMIKSVYSVLTLRPQSHLLWGDDF